MSQGLGWRTTARLWNPALATSALPFFMTPSTEVLCVVLHRRCRCPHRYMTNPASSLAAGFSLELLLRTFSLAVIWSRSALSAFLVAA